MIGHSTQYGAQAATVIAPAALSISTVGALKPHRIPSVTRDATWRGISAIRIAVVRGTSSCIRKAPTTRLTRYPAAPSSHGHATLTSATYAPLIAEPMKPTVVSCELR